MTAGLGGLGKAEFRRIRLYQLCPDRSEIKGMRNEKKIFTQSLPKEAEKVGASCHDLLYRRSFTA